VAFSLSRNERMYLQIQTAIRTILNTGGTADLAAADACRHIRLSVDNDVALIDRPDKTGSRSATAGIAGRQFGRWSAEASLVTSGVAGTVPDWDPILQSVMGKAATSNTGTTSIVSTTNATPIVVTATAHGITDGAPVFIVGSDDPAANGAWIIANGDANTFELVGSIGTAIGTAVGTVEEAANVYALDDSILSFSMWSFRTPAALQQRVGFGNVVTELTFSLGEDVPTWSASGEGVWVLDSEAFAAAGLTERGGLTAFPSEPASPVTAGGLIPGFTGRFVLNGTTIASARTAQIRIQTGNEVVKDTFGEYFPDSAEGDERNVGVSFNVYDTDATGLKALKAAAISKTALEGIFTLGTVAGNAYIFHMKGLQIAAPTLDDGQRRYSANFPESRAHGTSITSLNEIVIYAL